MANFTPSPNNNPPLGGVGRSTGVAMPLLFDDTTGRALVDSNAESVGLGLPEYDYVSMTLSAADTTETYIFKTGGSGGTTIATVVVVYTTSAREVLSTVTKT